MCKYDYDPYFPDPIDPKLDREVYEAQPLEYIVSVKRWRGKPPVRTSYKHWDEAVRYADSVSETSYVVLIVGCSGDVLKKYINYLHQ